MKKLLGVFLIVSMVCLLPAWASAEEGMGNSPRKEWQAKHEGMMKERQASMQEHQAKRQKMEAFHHKMQALRQEMEVEMAKVKQLREQMQALRQEAQSAGGMGEGMKEGKV